MDSPNGHPTFTEPFDQPPQSSTGASQQLPSTKPRSQLPHEVLHDDRGLGAYLAASHATRCDGKRLSMAQWCATSSQSVELDRGVRDPKGKSSSKSLLRASMVVGGRVLHGNWCNRYLERGDDHPTVASPHPRSRDATYYCRLRRKVGSSHGDHLLQGRGINMTQAALQIDMLLFKHLATLPHGPGLAGWFPALIASAS